MNACWLHWFALPGFALNLHAHPLSQNAMSIQFAPSLVRVAVNVVRTGVMGYTQVNLGNAVRLGNKSMCSLRSFAAEA